MTIILYCEPQSDHVDEVAVYDVMANTMVHQLQASGLQVVQTIPPLP